MEPTLILLCAMEPAFCANRPIRREHPATLGVVRHPEVHTTQRGPELRTPDQLSHSSHWHTAARLGSGSLRLSASRIDGSTVGAAPWELMRACDAAQRGARNGSTRPEMRRGVAAMVLARTDSTRTQRDSARLSLRLGSGRVGSGRRRVGSMRPCSACLGDCT
jgi:hypothetical protein